MMLPTGRQFWPSVAAIVFLWAFICIPGLFRPSLFDDADSSHAEAAREMVSRHDWVTLHQNGIRYLEKAPLPYWAMATSFLLFGVSEWAARLPQALGVFAPVLGSKTLALEIKKNYRAGDNIVSDGEYSTTSSINFYTGVQEMILNGRINGMWYGSLFPDAPQILLDDQQFEKIWAGSERVYFL